MRPTKSTTSKLGRVVRISLATVACATAALGFTAACLERPVVPAKPQTTNLFVDQIRQTTIDKIDLLFEIDNSISMSDKQAILKEAVPTLLRRLINPNCVKKDDASMVTMAVNNACPAGYEREFSPVADIHIGVISSSLGGHGGTACTDKDPSWKVDKNDAGRLIGTLDRGKAIPTYSSLGFLQWDPTSKKMPPGETSGDALIANFQEMVVKAGEQGCGYEAQLESWYRFLVDPAPYASVSQVNSATVKAGLDQAVLDQRKAFLRADSLLAIIMLTDENDCSVIDESLGWLVGTTAIDSAGVQKTFNMIKPTSTCDTEPNSPCCRSCAVLGNPPAGCGPVAADPNCTPDAANNNSLALKAADDPANLRCFNQKKRFGLDLLYPTERYVYALQSETLPDPSDPTGMKKIKNPIYDDPSKTAPFIRGPELVFLAGIVGVPWQDIADDASLTGTGLKYKTWTELSVKDAAGATVWDDILGVPNTGLNPKDPLMIESVAPRTGTNPRLAKALAPPTSTNPRENPINGHEFNNVDKDDLQYACIFELAEPKNCLTTMGGCDCGSMPGMTMGSDLAAITKKVTDNNSPLCNPPAGGAPSTTQYFAKGYPGLRILQVLKDFGPNSIVASICPKLSAAAQKADPSYGYNPAVAAIIDRLKEALGGRCLPRKLTPDKETGKVPCKVIEARKPKEGETCGCGPGREPGIVGSTPETEKLGQAVLLELQKQKTCTDAASCASICMCEVTQLAKDPGCEVSDPPPAGKAGYCYIDAAQGIGSAALLTACPASEKRKLRFVGENTPASGATTFIACAGASADDDPVVAPAPAM
ncbi:MAG: hypothetical protein SFV15_03655 [Polyangiaceae bacterium]|nr:hypothetical protein [Polyangiaceae bacterium]